MIARRQVTRRGFLGAAAAAWVASPSRGQAAAQTLRGEGGPRVLDEGLWGRVQADFDLDRSAIYLNAAGVAPAPRSAMASVVTDMEFRNRLPARHLWRVLQPRVEAVRHQVAQAVGCDPEGLALTRGATEAMEIVQMGLDFRPGDEIVTTDHDFFRMLNSWEQRAQRDGVVVKRVAVPTPPERPAALVEALEQAITPRTRLVAFCHITNVNGQIYPVRQLCELARTRGVPTLVDGAQAFGHIAMNFSDLGCDYYAGSLHKYALAPLGTGFLAMRRERIAEVWPLNPAAASRREDIRKFEDVGTHQAAPHNAVGEALRYREALGQEAVTERLQQLTARWTEALAEQPGITLFNRFTAEHTCGIATFGMVDTDPRELVDELWTRFGVVVRPVTLPDCQGVRVSPHIYNTLHELDRFVAAVIHLNEERRNHS